MKWLLLICSLLAIFLALGHFFAKKTVRSEVVINAPVNDVWAVIDDTANYPEWNPSMQVIDGTVAEGGKVAYQFTDSQGVQSKITATVKQKVANEVLYQSGGILTIITYDNYWRVEPIDDNITKVSITENYTGVYVWFWNADSVEQAYQLQNEALRQRVEQTINK